MIRLFVGVALPRMIRERLAGLCGGVPGARWSESENFHLTLRFIGEVDTATLADSDAVLAQVRAASFSLTLEGVGVFGTAKPRTLWAGVAPCPPLRVLHGRVEAALARLPLPPQESRRYTPHVTLARLKDPAIPRLTRFLSEQALFQAGPVPVRDFHLYESCAGRSGVLYRVLQTYPLLFSDSDPDSDPDSDSDFDPGPYGHGAATDPP